MDRESMIFQIMMNTRYSEEALEKMTNAELEELYQVKVEKI
ncbi:hypothetical protein [Bacillus sp. 1P02SD]